jgi:hypothetical protein
VFHHGFFIRWGIDADLCGRFSTGNADRSQHVSLSVYSSLWCIIEKCCYQLLRETRTGSRSRFFAGTTSIAVCPNIRFTGQFCPCGIRLLLVARPTCIKFQISRFHNTGTETRGD